MLANNEGIHQMSNDQSIDLIIDYKSPKTTSSLPLRMEFHLSYIFFILNQSTLQTTNKRIKNFQDKNQDLVSESNNLKKIALFQPNIAFKQVWKRISPTNLVQLVNFLLLEKRVILISKSYECNAIVIEYLLDLIAPLNSSVFNNISFLMAEMIDYLDSPMPFIIGISSDLWHKIYETKWHEISDDTIAFDIDTEVFKMKLNSIDCPEPQTSSLVKSLMETHERYNTYTVEECSDTNFLIQVKQSFYNYLLLVINDFRLHFKEEPEKGKVISPRIQLDKVFDFDQFLESQNEVNKVFYQQFIETQMFNDFVERTYNLQTRADE
mmetsp:Transcript_40573/g.39112  ORF Transcript_40573/g.39112 Transcript_40573/m.39112 type:complete len:323 (+) Transcript_40573:611-1579(+)|eukprot:CAMPEP_0170547936 /NCGR_PEP_ID=MMETSP0211-20121228/6237_1 /TAXON_ID=311385 /ORGANISM="Pseudokeronopsis sp., Strain OXSARD2" /LENGTH=322 /DNA_ID=CAMNT_0010853169 /DNA_START=578 /DNA_END=1546 /DNA_ORIENTATION=+